MEGKDSVLLEKLMTSIKTRKFDPNIVCNISCFHQNKLIVWNEDDQCLCICSFHEQYKISDIQIVTLSCFPSFLVNSLSISPSGNYLALYGIGGLMIAELPRNWSISCRDHSDTLLIRSFSINERMFLCNRNLKLLCFRWHPISKRHLVVLTNDNFLRVFDIENEFEPIKTINLNTKNWSNSSIYSDSLGENSISFDFGPSLSHYQSSGLPNRELIDIYSIFILKENGDVSLIYLNLKDVSSLNQIYGPLKMTPAAEDNYGAEACTILCLDCVPPIIVIGTNSGLLYHCVAIENEPINEEFDKSNSYNEVYFITTSQTNIFIPEIILYVLETIELSFPLSSYQENNGTNNLDVNTALHFITDLKDPKRYFCIHSFGVHVILVSFFKQLVNPTVYDFHDEKAIVEYLICTRPTIDYNENSTYPIGIALIINNGFTSITVLLSTGELISKRLSNIIFANEGENSMYIKNLNSPEKKSDEQSLIIKSSNEKLNKKPNFSEHINKILTKNISVPFIKSCHPKNSLVGPMELEILLNSIDVLRKEYLDKFNLAAKAIEKRKTVLRNDLKFQLKEIENLKEEKDLILKQYVNLVDKCEQIQETAKHFTKRLEKTISAIQNQRPTLSDAEWKLKEELTKEQGKISLYKEQFEQIKRKHRYQDTQFRKSSLQTVRSPSQNLEIHSQFQIKNIKMILTDQANQIKELLEIINLLKNSI